MEVLASDEGCGFASLETLLGKGEGTVVPVELGPDTESTHGSQSLVGES